MSDSIKLENQSIATLMDSLESKVNNTSTKDPLPQFTWPEIVEILDRRKEAGQLTNADSEHLALYAKLMETREPLTKLKETGTGDLLQAASDYIKNDKRVPEQHLRELYQRGSQGTLQRAETDLLRDVREKDAEIALRTGKEKLAGEQVSVLVDSLESKALYLGDKDPLPEIKPFEPLSAKAERI